jgi:oxygen-independent coproporphyrinogen-3 oxidase
MKYANVEAVRERSDAKEILQFEERDPCYTWLFPLALGPFDPRTAWRPTNIPQLRANLTVYIHIPFCRFICEMCPFTHEPLGRKDLARYVDSLCSEIQFYSQHPRVDGNPVTTLYFGGGTASSLSVAQIERIMQEIRRGYRVAENCEITLECHPRTVDRTYLKEIQSSGINRVSFGIQSFSQANIRSLHLHQDVEQSKQILGTALGLGFRSVALDLMYRYPNQTVQDLQEELDEVIALGVHGVSVYALDAEVRDLNNVARLQPEIKIEEEMYYYLHDRLIDEGFVHVAQPDYARPNHENRQLYDLWGAPQAENLSFGAGAFSECFNGSTWANVHDSNLYIEVMERGDLPVLIGQNHSWDDAAARYAALGVRCLALPFQPFRTSFGVDFRDLYRFEIESLAARGLVSVDDATLTVTRRGKFFIDNISKVFFNPRNRGKSQLWGVNLTKLVPEKTVRRADLLKTLAISMDRAR